MPDDTHSLIDLARLAGVTPRTVRYYVAQGLLPSPDAAGPATRYGETHLARLRLIRRLQRDHLPLAEIRARLERMGDDEVMVAAEALATPEPEPSRAAGDTLAYVRSLMAQSGVRPTIAGQPVGLATAGPADPVGAAHSLAIPATGPGLLERLTPMAAPTADAAPAPGVPAPDRHGLPDRTTWERLVITPDVELHVRRPLDRRANKRVDQLERIARELFEDDT